MFEYHLSSHDFVGVRTFFNTPPPTTNQPTFQKKTPSSKKSYHPLFFVEQPTTPYFLCQLPNFPVKCVFFHHPRQPSPPEMSCGCPKPPLDEGRAVRFPRLVPTSVEFSDA